MGTFRTTSGGATTFDKALEELGLGVDPVGRRPAPASGHHAVGHLQEAA